MPLLLRISKRKTSWEDGVSIEDIVEAEFTHPDGQTDLRVSVYEVSKEQVVQIFVEHSAAAKLNLPAGRTNVDLNGAATVLVAPETGSFDLVNQSHREIVFESSIVLHNFLGKVRQDGNTRLHTVTSAEIKEYVRDKLRSRVQVWVDLAAEKKSWNI